MTARIWHKGPPPHAGWWNAGFGRRDEWWRWWDGELWSDSAHETESSASAGKSALKRQYIISYVEWTDYWPENARVPRVDPGKKIAT